MPKSFRQKAYSMQYLLAAIGWLCGLQLAMTQRCRLFESLPD
ncbi:hypothetical protein EBME_1782 [bacterium endosymbiont of Mortierella elongata FMR23-6]|nr:hypothetical protein EBME_1782 [bacterium endosymbiont of Mortierella elongata FMR23-6]